MARSKYYARIMSLYGKCKGTRKSVKFSLYCGSPRDVERYETFNSSHHDVRFVKTLVPSSTSDSRKSMGTNGIHKCQSPFKIRAKTVKTKLYVSYVYEKFQNAGFSDFLNAR